jgi:hypothetical protein
MNWDRCALIKNTSFAWVSSLCSRESLPGSINRFQHPGPTSRLHSSMNSSSDTPTTNAVVMHSQSVSHTHPHSHLATLWLDHYELNSSYTHARYHTVNKVTGCGLGDRCSVSSRGRNFASRYCVSISSVIFPAINAAELPAVRKDDHSLPYSF